MTPKEKAEELVNKYLLATPTPFHIDDAKKCALITVHEIISLVGRYTNYWQEVKEEIYKL